MALLITNGDLGSLPVQEGTRVDDAPDDVGPISAETFAEAYDLSVARLTLMRRYVPADHWAALEEEWKVVKREELERQAGAGFGPCAFCGGPMSRNPHPDAGKPDRVMEVGALFVCIPCSFQSKRAAIDHWKERAVIAAGKLELLAEEGKAIADGVATKYLDESEATRAGDTFLEIMLTAIGREGNVIVGPDDSPASDTALMRCVGLFDAHNNLRAAFILTRDDRDRTQITRVTIAARPKPESIDFPVEFEQLAAISLEEAAARIAIAKCHLIVRQAVDVPQARQALSYMRDMILAQSVAEARDKCPGDERVTTAG